MDGYHHETAHQVLGVTYESATPPLVYDRPSATIATTVAEDEDRDFIADDKLRIYYAGDYCSRRPPGFEAACLSGLDAAQHIASILGVQDSQAQLDSCSEPLSLTQPEHSKE